MSEPEEKSTPPADGEATKPGDELQAGVEDRWWVDAGKKRRQSGRPDPVRQAETIVGDRFFSIGKGFDQDRARDILTDTNLSLIEQTNPEQGKWALISLNDQSSNPKQVDKVQRSLRLPKWARGVIIDSGSSMRAVATGDPVGERMIEITLGSQPCFDAYAGGEWVFEKSFRNRDRALREGSRLIARFLRSRQAL